MAGRIALGRPTDVESHPKLADLTSLGRELIGHVGVTAVAAEGRFWQAQIMRHSFRRACLFILLIVALTVGQVPIVGHAGSMSHDAVATMDMAAPTSARCDACDRMVALDDGAACSLPCTSVGPALPVVASSLTTWIGLRFAPIAWSPLLDGRTIPPEPGPPRAFA
jgi:hypothetical protein